MVYTVSYVAVIIFLYAQWQQQWRTGLLFLSTGYLLGSTRAEANTALNEFPSLAAHVEGNSVVCATGGSHTWAKVKFDSNDRIAAYRFCVSNNPHWISTREESMLAAIEDVKSQERLDLEALQVSFRGKDIDQTLSKVEYVITDQMQKGWIVTAAALGGLLDATRH